MGSSKTRHLARGFTTANGLRTPLSPRGRPQVSLVTPAEARPLSGPVSTGRSARSGCLLALRARRSRWIRRLSSTSAIRTAYEHNHESPDPQGSMLARTADPIASDPVVDPPASRPQLALGLEQAPDEVEAPSATPTAS